MILCLGLAAHLYCSNRAILLDRELPSDVTKGMRQPGEGKKDANPSLLKVTFSHTPKEGEEARTREADNLWAIPALEALAELPSTNPLRRIAAEEFIVLQLDVYKKLRALLRAYSISLFPDGAVAQKRKCRLIRGKTLLAYVAAFEGVLTEENQSRKGVELATAAFFCSYVASTAREKLREVVIEEGEAESIDDWLALVPKEDGKLAPLSEFRGGGNKKVESVLAAIRQERHKELSCNLTDQLLGLIPFAEEPTLLLEIAAVYLAVWTCLYTFHKLDYPAKLHSILRGLGKLLSVDIACDKGRRYIALAG